MNVINMFPFDQYTRTRTALITKLAHYLRDPAIYQAAAVSAMENTQLQVRDVNNLILSYVNPQDRIDAFIRYATIVCDIVTAGGLTLGSAYTYYNIPSIPYNIPSIPDSYKTYMTKAASVGVAATVFIKNPQVGYVALIKASYGVMQYITNAAPITLSAAGIAAVYLNASTTKSHIVSEILKVFCAMLKYYIAGQSNSKETNEHPVETEYKVNFTNLTSTQIQALAKDELKIAASEQEGQCEVNFEAYVQDLIEQEAEQFSEPASAIHDLVG